MSVSTPLLDPKDTTEYRSYMDVDKIEALLIECNKKLHDVFSEEIVRNIEYMREQVKKIENVDIDQGIYKVKLKVALNEK